MCMYVCVNTHIYITYLSYEHAFLENLCEQQEFVISNKIFYVDSFPFFPRGFLFFFFPQLSFRFKWVPAAYFFPSYFCLPCLCREHTEVKGGPFLDWYLLIKWGLLASMSFCNSWSWRTGGNIPIRIICDRIQVITEQKFMEILTFPWEITVERTNHEGYLKCVKGLLASLRLLLSELDTCSLKLALCLCGTKIVSLYLDIVRCPSTELEFTTIALASLLVSPCICLSASLILSYKYERLLSCVN